MKNAHISLFALAATPVLLSTTAFAGAPSMMAPAPAPVEHTECGEFGSYLGVRGVIADTTVRIPNSGIEETAGTAGFIVDGGFLFAHGFSLDGFFQYLEDSDDASSYDFGAVLNYKHEIANGFSAFAGAGYEFRKIDIDQDDVQYQAILANVGLEYQNGRFLSRLTYTQGFTNSSELNVDLGGGSIEFGLDDEDTGTLGLMGAFQVCPNISITAAGTVELLQEAAITDDWTASLGVRYDF